MENVTQETALHSRSHGTKTGFLKHLLAIAHENDYSFAAWRLPGEAETRVIVSFKTASFELSSHFEELPEGFIFYPFDSSTSGVFLKADVRFTFRDNVFLEDESPQHQTSLRWFEERLRSSPSFNLAERKIQPSNEESKSTDDFRQLVAMGIRNIARGDFEKIVPSRYKTVTLPVSFDPTDAFDKLSKAYPGALVSLVHSPMFGTWLGATPEVLVSTEKNIFRTVALAGTQVYTEGTNLKQVAWTQKEIEEQALVSRYIINCFKKIRLREFEEHGPKTIVAGNLMHLKTEFSVDMKATNFPQLGSVMLRLLHPTSAVCGMPMESAKKFLLEHEGYNREFYSGFLGPVNVEGGSHLFVNLRCMQLFSDQAVCYAGAGVTQDSVPEKEWEETEMKMNTLLQVIR